MIKEEINERLQDSKTQDPPSGEMEKIREEEVSGLITNKSLIWWDLFFSIFSSFPSQLLMKGPGGHWQVGSPRLTEK
jgi:hypothetical protein